MWGVLYGGPKLAQGTRSYWRRSGASRAGTCKKAGPEELIDAALFGANQAAKLAEGAGVLSLGLGVVDGVGKLDGSIAHRINQSVSLFAAGSLDTSSNWQAMTGLKVKW